MNIDFSKNKVSKHMWEGNFGLEKESLRVTTAGFLAHTQHPFQNNPNMERDFCENQTELITDVMKSPREVWEELRRLQKKAVTTLWSLESGRELLWPFSNPPYVRGDDDIHIATYYGRLKGKELYREYLAEKYGKRKMLFSGIHFNFSFSDSFLEAGFENSDYKDFRTYKDEVYLDLAKKATKYSWLIVYLTAASPVMDGSWFQDEKIGRDVCKNLASPRCSKIGYWNDFTPILKYDTIEAYTESIEIYVNQGQLKEASELYYPIRLKPAGENSLENLRKNGVNHIEFRMLDVNPLDAVGICLEDLEFLQLLILYLVSLTREEFLPFEQNMAIKNQKRAAMYEEDKIWIETGWNSSMQIRNAAISILTSMVHFYEKIGAPEAINVVYNQMKKIFCPRNRYAVQIREEFQKDYVKKGVELAKKYAREMMETKR